MKISELYGKDIYTDKGNYLGQTRDVIINLQKGNVVRLVMEHLKSISKAEAKKVLKEQSVLFRKVKSIGDIVIVGTHRKSPSEEQEPRETERDKRTSKLKQKYSISDN